MVFIIWATEGRFRRSMSLRNRTTWTGAAAALCGGHPGQGPAVYHQPPGRRRLGRGMAQPRLSRFCPTAAQLVGAEAEPEPEFHRRSTSRQASPRDGNGGRVLPGRRVTHPVFGLGRVLEHQVRQQDRDRLRPFRNQDPASGLRGLKPADRNGRLPRVGCQRHELQQPSTICSASEFGIKSACPARKTCWNGWAPP